jgi:hypothetical protein
MHKTSPPLEILTTTAANQLQRPHPASGNSSEATKPLREPDHPGRRTAYIQLYHALDVSAMSRRTENRP